MLLENSRERSSQLIDTEEIDSSTVYALSSKTFLSLINSLYLFSCAVNNLKDAFIIDTTKIDPNAITRAATRTSAIDSP